MQRVFWFGALVTVGLATACGPTCGEACRKIYEPSECGIQPGGGVSSSELIETCSAACDQALESPGQLNGYNPGQRQLRGFELQNETQAAAWMDCVWEAECDTLQGDCFPI